MPQQLETETFVGSPFGGGGGPGLVFPSALTTGPAAGGFNSLIPTTAGTIQNAPYPSWVTVQGDGSLLVSGRSFTDTVNWGTSVPLTFRGCSWSANAFYCLNNIGAGTNITLDYCQMSGVSSDTSVTYGVAATDNMTVTHCNMFWIQEQPVQSGGNNCLVRGNFIHDLAPTASGHYEPLYMGGVSPGNYTTAHWTVSGNTFWCEIGPNTTACIFMDGAHGQNFDDITITGNLLAGGAYTLYLGQEPTYTVTNMAVTGNWFSTKFESNCGAFGYATNAPVWNSGGNTWSGNKWYDGPLAGQLLAAP